MHWGSSFKNFLTPLQHFREGRLVSLASGVTYSRQSIRSSKIAKKQGSSCGVGDSEEGGEEGVLFLEGEGADGDFSGGEVGEGL